MQDFPKDVLVSTLRERFGFPAFRPGQLAAVSAVMQQGRVLCVHPTGFGKSLLYQLPATLLEGVTLVISPLLALMRDQEQQLNERFSIAAASLNSDQDDAENAAVRRKLAQGDVKVLFVAPEQLDHVDRFEQLLQLPVSLVVVDEAHCISTWGHDFRPSYRQILNFVMALVQRRPQTRMLGLTATANARVEQDIVQQLTTPGDGVTVLRESMSRPNIALSVWCADGLAGKLVACLQLVREFSGCGLIYCATRDHTEIVARYLATQGVDVAAYHAGMAPEHKRSMQVAFVRDAYKVLVATNALGMGIDKSNLRFIIHFDVPGSITAYYQEIGRCGRDGAPAWATLLFDAGDLRIQEYFIASAQPSADDFAKVLAAVTRAEAPPNLITIKRETGLHPTRVTVVLAELVEQGHLRKQGGAGGQKYVRCEQSGAPNLARYTAQRQVRDEELARMRGYAEQSAICRMEILRRALGDTTTEPCGTCSVCRGAPMRTLQHSEQLPQALAWIGQQGVEIAADRVHDVAAGMALLDGKTRAPTFVRLMRERATEANHGEHGLPAELWNSLAAWFGDLAKAGPIAALVPIPSRTWRRRANLLACVQSQLDVPVLDSWLQWLEVPPQRQGELLNNDQRRFNVHRRMTTQGTPVLRPGVVVLFDDYVGSGQTLKEAARALRKHAGVKAGIKPLTLAAVKWKLGSAGMI